jgi:hypothetical protein
LLLWGVASDLFRDTRGGGCLFAGLTPAISMRLCSGDISTLNMCVCQQGADTILAIRKRYVVDMVRFESEQVKR